MIFNNKELFKAAISAEAVSLFSKRFFQCTTVEKYTALVRLLRREASEIQAESTRRQETESQKHIYYFSMEFLIGRLLKNYLMNLGVTEVVEDALHDLGLTLDDLAEVEQDPGLGNGGLGRLAACFLDSLAFLGKNATGMGVRFRYGLFRQHIESGWQTEEPDNWLDGGYPWETAKHDEAVIVKFGGRVTAENGFNGLEYTLHDYEAVRAVPYDVPVVGYGGQTVNTLRLWRSVPVHEELDLAAFNRGDYAYANKRNMDVEAITCILYPDDSSDAGKALRLKQEYFFTSAGLQNIINTYKLQHGTEEWELLPQRVAVHTNDTHPALAVPELMRLLVDEEGLEWDAAWRITTQTIAYTNHTVMPEALEKWSTSLYSRLLPRVYMITEEIDRRYRAGFDRSLPDWERLLEETAPIRDGSVNMAHLSIIGSHSINGVAALHTQILKDDVMKAFYAVCPEKFNNKTNGVSHRRFLMESNPDLSALIDKGIGDGWRRDALELEKLLSLRGDAAFLTELAAVKRRNKERLAAFIARKNHITVDPDSIFDVQVKRIHAYKRQVLYIFRALSLYNALKAYPTLDVPPRTFIVAGKAAQSYAFAKESIKLCCSVADKINSDPDMNGRLKVVFLENFNVSSAQVIYPGADVSEQISTAGKEASGTGCMKFMMNGALTLGTLDGANVEIHQLVGDENMYLFGMNADEAARCHREGYNAAALRERDGRLMQLTEQLINGFFNDSGCNFWGIYDALLRKNDEFLVLGDYASYMDVAERMARDYRDSAAWFDKVLVNIAKSGYFSSDRTIREYCGEIWQA